MAQTPEPWLRGPLADVHPLVMPILFSFAQVREDLGTHVADLSSDQLWQPISESSVGYHLQHLAGSVDRLITYVLGQPLSTEQLAALAHEHTRSGSASELIDRVDRTLTHAEKRLREVNTEQPFAARTVGRAQLPTTVLGLLVHLAEHTQRHLGQAITLSQVVRQLPAPSSR